MLKSIGLGLVAIVAVFATMFALKSMGMISYSFFGTWEEEIRYDIQKESQAYRDGMQRNLTDLKFQFQDADSAGKVGIRQAVRHQYSQTDTSEYPAHLQTFLAQMGL